MPAQHAVDHATEFKAISGQINVDEAEGIVECFVSGVGNKDSVGDIVLPGAFTESLKRRKPRVVWGHDWNHPIGKVLEIFEVGPEDRRLPAKMKQAGIGGLFARVQFNLKSEKGREAFNSVAFYGEDQEWSIGYKTLDAVYDNARKANLLREVELYEVSPVLHGANQLTGTISIKSDNADDEAVDSFRKSKWKMFDREFAAMIKEEYPEIWAKGGNIKGNAQYAILTKIAENGGVAKTPDQTAALELREAWVARHAGDFRLPGVIAQIKWLAVGSRGEAYMKNVVRDAIAKIEQREKGAAYMMMPSPMNQPEMEDDETELSPKMHGMMMDPRRYAVSIELARRFGGPVKIREMETNMLIYDRMTEDGPITMRIGYHQEGSQFMFGEPQRVKPRVVYMEVEDGDDEDEDDDDGAEYGVEYEGKRPDGGKGCGCGCKGNCGGKPSATAAILEQLNSIMKSADFIDVETKAGRVISSGNLQKLQQAMDLLREVIAAGGRAEIELKESDYSIEAPIEELFALKSFMDPVFEHYGANVEVVENGIIVKSISSIDEFENFNNAVHNAVTTFKQLGLND